MRWFYLSLVALLAMPLFYAAPVVAQPQVLEPSVGQLEIQINPILRALFKEFGDDVPEWLPICTATAVTPTVALSASHCILDDMFRVYERAGRQSLGMVHPWSTGAVEALGHVRLGLVPLQETVTCDEDMCWTEAPVVVGYRVGFYRGNVGHVVYRSATVAFSGFRVTDPHDVLAQVDVSILRIAKYDQTFGLHLANIPAIGTRVWSTGFSLGIRQWSGAATVRGLYLLDGYGWVVIVQSPDQEWNHGASGSVVYNAKREIVGILTLGGDPDMLGNFVGVVPPGIVRMALERAHAL